MAELPSRPAGHARFVNTLSLLEHIGSVKIARTQAGAAITEQVLQHLAEETRHAQVLKRIVRTIDPPSSLDYHDTRLLAGSTARGYFARLDAGVRAFVRRELPEERRAQAAYNLVTWLVELRASWLYPAYQRVLENVGLRISVRSIIGEEERHLAEIVEGLREIGIENHPGLGELLEHEEQLFARLAGEMMNDE